MAIVGFAPRSHRLADVPRGMILEEHEDLCALGRHVGGEPGEHGAGDHAAGTSWHNARPHGLGCRHVASITGHGVALWVRGQSRRFHQVARLISAPGMPLGLGVTAPPHGLFEAQRSVRIGRGYLEQAVPAFLSAPRPSQD